MNDQIRPVGIGIAIGIITLIFGISWAIYLVVGHDSIHRILEESVKARLDSAVASGSAALDEASHGHGTNAVHDKGVGKEAYKTTPHMHGAAERRAGGTGISGPHSDELMDAAHKRLTRGHIHAMGLGILAIALSTVLSFTGAPAWLKKTGSICLGAGGFIYPFSWIIMGYRTPAMGIAASQESILSVVAMSVPLVLLGLFITLFYVVKGLCKERGARSQKSP